RADRFDQRMASYRAQPWQVDDELRLLLQSAKDVQGRVRHSRYVDEHTAADWSETVRVLNRMIRLYQADVNGLGRYQYDTRPPVSEHDHGYGEAPAPAYDERYPPADRGPRPQGAYGFSRERLSALAHELEDRATRAHELAE